MDRQRRWAFMRQLQYGTGFMVFVTMLSGLAYFSWFYSPATCFDNAQNGDERGVDCGGDCLRICTVDTVPPTTLWARSFEVTEGQYNAVAYIENQNTIAASPALPYTISLYDEAGLITSRTGTTILPPDSVYPVFEARINTNGRIPTQTFIELGTADEWYPASAGREQFTVVSRTLTGVDSQPRLEARLYNNSLTAASDVEVVATIFDAAGNALTASRTYVDEFSPRSETVAYFTWPQPIAKTIRSCEVPTDIAVMIDVSGSMNNDSDSPPEPITSVVRAAEAFVNRLQSRDQATLVTFATDAAVVTPLTAATDRVASQIAALFIEPEEEQGATNTGDALYRALDELSSARHNEEARRVAVLLTDGLATAPDESPEAYALTAAEALKATGIELYTIGLGAQVNMEFVRQLASDEAKAYEALSVQEINRIYQRITSDLCVDGPAIIEIIPKTTAGFEVR